MKKDYEGITVALWMLLTTWVNVDPQGLGFLISPTS
jgi:hypothetical protein